MQKNNSTSLLLGLLTILFIGLKLANIINWDWLWVLSPFWIPLLIFCIIFLILIIINYINARNLR